MSANNVMQRIMWFIKRLRSSDLQHLLFENHIFRIFHWKHCLLSATNISPREDFLEISHIKQRVT